MRRASWWTLGGAALLAALAHASAATAQAATPESIAQRHAALLSRYAAELETLAADAERAGLSAQAGQARAWLPVLPPNTLRFAQRPAIATDAATAHPSANESPAAKEWRERFEQVRAAQGDSLFALSGDAVKEGQASRAFPLLVETLRENPDHAEARKILGYERVDDRWRTPYEARKTREKQVWHPMFGWLPAANVKRYEGGEQFYRGRWMKAADANRLGVRPKHGWDVATEHYVVHTDHSLEEGVRLATRLERLYDVWQQAFAAFCASEKQLARRYNGQAAVRREPAQHKVVLFRDRDEYVEALRREQPNIGVTTGFYLATKREAYFYFVEGERDDSNLYHEATHQLFSEIRPVSRELGREANFWIIEGIACYMESLVEQDGWTLLGGNDAVRLRDAQHRLLADNFYVPLTELTAFGMEQLQRDPRIAMLYSESAGLTHFLMHFDQGRYRRPLVEYLLAVYSGRDRAGTLAELSGESDVKLDEQYRQFLKSIP